MRLRRLILEEAADLACLAALVRERVWVYLTEVAKPYELASVAEDLFQLPRGDLRRLAAAHLGVSREAELMLAAAEQVLRDLPRTAARNQVELRGAMKPPVAWRETSVRRLQAGDRSLFVCRPPERRYDTPLARLVKLALTLCSEISDTSGLKDQGTIGSIIAGRAAHAGDLGRHPKLRDVPMVRGIPAHALHGAIRNPNVRPIVEFINLYREAVTEQTLATLQELVTRQLLIPSEPDLLLEWFVGFQLIDELAALGYERIWYRLLPGLNMPFARMKDPAGRKITIWYQRSLRSIFPGAPEGRYRQTLAAAGLKKSSLKPDFVVVTDPAENVLLVEVKFTSRDDVAADRVGIKDALTYLHDGAKLLSGKPLPQALVIAWASSAAPALAGVMVGPPAAVGDAIRLTMGSWNML